MDEELVETLLEGEESAFKRIIIEEIIIPLGIKKFMEDAGISRNDLEEILKGKHPNNEFMNRLLIYLELPYEDEDALIDYLKKTKPIARNKKPH